MSDELTHEECLKQRSELVIIVAEIQEEISKLKNLVKNGYPREQADRKISMAVFRKAQAEKELTKIRQRIKNIQRERTRSKRDKSKELRTI